MPIDDVYEEFVDHELLGCKLKMLCIACPELYEVYHEVGYIGYLRLRHGTFRAESDEGNVVYTAHPEGDGIFTNEEREHYLTEGVRALMKEAGLDV